MRYEGQGSEDAVAWPGGIAEGEVAFAAAHRALYGFTLPSRIERVTLRVEASGLLPALAAGSAPGGTVAALGRTPVHFRAGTQEATLYARDGLPAGAVIAGPAILTQLDSTTLVPPGWRA